MNKVIFVGRLVADPETRYGANNVAVSTFKIAVQKKFKKEGEIDADFFRITALGKQGEFAEKYLNKGLKILVEGEIRNNNYTNKDGQMVYQDQIVATSIEFMESKSAQNKPVEENKEEFMSIPDNLAEELPFN